MRIRFAVVFVTLAAVASLSIAGQTQTAETMMEAARKLEVVDGDMTGAIKQYQAVVDRFSRTDRRAAASALLRVAALYEKQASPRAEEIYARVAREYADVTSVATEARARLRPSPLAAAPSSRQLWTPKPDFAFGSISADGRYLSLSDWSTGDLTLHDFTTGRDRRLTNKRTWQESGDYTDYSTTSRDGRQVAYAWYSDAKQRYELRVVGTDPVVAATPRVLFENPDVEYLAPFDWSPDGRWIATWLGRKDNTIQIALVATRDGALTVLKSPGWRPLSERMAFSPDGRLLAYDLLPDDATRVPDVFVISVDGSREIQAVRHPATDTVVGWSPDGTLLFKSDRAGGNGLWSQPFASGRPAGEAVLLSTSLGASAVPLGVTKAGALVFAQQTSARKVYTAEVDFASGHLLSSPKEAAPAYLENRHSPIWSWDGQSLAYAAEGSKAANGAIIVHSLRSGLTRRVKPALSGFRCLQWAPDGTLACHGTDLKGRAGIFQVDAETGDASRILSAENDAYTIVPTWSADGRTLVYLNNVKTGTTIVARDAASGSERPLIRLNGPYAGFAGISPNGRLVAYATNDRATKKQTIYTLSTEGGQPREILTLAAPKILTGNLLAIEWTRDSEQLVFTQSEAGAPSTWVLPLDGRAPIRIDPAISRPNSNVLRIHPDGRRVAFVDGESRFAVWRLENFLTPRSPAASTALRTQRVLAEGAPWDRISPDGRYLVRVDSTTENLSLIELATGKMRPLTTDGRPEDPDHRFPLASAFSRDGKHVANEWYFEKDNRSVLRVVSTEEDNGGTPRNLYDNPDVQSIAPTDWSPDGRWIAAVIRRVDRTAQIGVIKVDDGSLRVLKTVEWSRVGGLRFSPDSSLLAYHRAAVEGRFERDVFVIAVDGSKESVAAASPGDDIVLEWARDGKRLLVASDRSGSTSVWSVIGSGQTQPSSYELIKSDVGVISSLGPTHDGTLFYNMQPASADIYVATFDSTSGQLSSSTMQPIQQFKGLNASPQWSGDGRYLAYGSKRDIPAPINVTRLVVPIHAMAINATERELHPKLSYGGVGRWSPDGRHFIVRGADLKGRSGILTVDAETGDATLVVSGDTCDGVPFWAPDSKSFYCYRFEEQQIVQVDIVSGNVLRTIRSESQGAAISADGRYIAYMEPRGQELKLLMVASGKTRTLITLAPPSRIGNMATIDFTPDGKAVVYGQINGGEGMWFTPLDGGASHRIDVNVGRPIIGWRFNTKTNQVAFTTNTTFGRLEVWKMENFLP